MKPFVFLLLPLLAGVAPSLANTANDLVAYPSGKTQTLAHQPTSVRIVNIWATWCAPCRKEMPAMSAWYQKRANKKKVELIGIALDHENNMAKFLKTTPVSYPIWRYAGKDSRAFMQTLGNQVGALPYTIVEAKGCRFKQQITGEVNGKKLDDAILLLQQQCSK